MKKVLLILLILPSISFAETGIQFFKGTWTEVQAEAKKQHKIIFVDVFTTWCGPCKLMEKNVFPNPKVGEKFNANFINYQLDAEKGEGITLAQKYQVEGYPSSLFINQNGELLHRKIGAMQAEEFMKEADNALEVNKTDKSLTIMEEEYKSGNRGAEFMKLFIRKKKMNEENITGIFDEYIDNLSEKDYKDSKVAELLAEHTASMDSKAFEALLKFYKKRLGLSQESSYLVSNGMAKLEKSALKQSIQANDKTLFEKLISIMKTKLGKIPFEIEKVQMDFAEATKDSLLFKEVALKKVPVLLKPSNEDLRKQSKMTFDMFKIGSKRNKADTTAEFYLSTLKYFERVAETSTANELNSLAWGYFKLINDQRDLEEALKWSIRSIELENSPNSMDTQANLLFKLGRKKEGIKKMKEAIKLAKRTGAEIDGFEETLKKMKQK